MPELGEIAKVAGKVKDAEDAADEPKEDPKDDKPKDKPAPSNSGGEESPPKSQPSVEIPSISKENVAAAGVGAGVGFGAGAMANWGGRVVESASAAGHATKSHIQENIFFLFVFFIAILDATNNLSRGMEPVYINAFMLVALLILFAVILLFPKATFWVVLLIIGLGVVAFFTGFIDLNFPTLPAVWFFFIAYLMIFFWAWLYEFKEEGEHVISKQGLMKFGLYLGISAVVYFKLAQWLLVKAFGPSEIIMGIVTILPIWLIYSLFKIQTKMTRVLGFFYIVFIIILIMFTSGAAQAAIEGASSMAAEGGAASGEVDAKGGVDSLIDQISDSISSTQRQLSGEEIQGDVKPETRDLFVGMEFQESLIGSSDKFDFDKDRSIKVDARFHSYYYKQPQGSATIAQITCYGASSDTLDSTTEFLNTEHMSQAAVGPGSVWSGTFTEDFIFPEDVSCTYEAASRANQIIALQATATNFRTDAFIENYFIDRTSMRSALEQYALDNHKPLGSIAATRAALPVIYKGLPSQITSFSDNGPALLLIHTSDFPLEGIDETELGSFVLKSALENHQVATTSRRDEKGRIEQVRHVSIRIPAGLSPSSAGCAGWSHSGDTITLTQDSLATASRDSLDIDKNEQIRFPDCQIVLTDTDAILLKPDKPNPATFHGTVIYDYTVQRKHTIISKNPRAPSSSSSSSSSDASSTPSNTTTEQTTSGAEETGDQQETGNPGNAAS